MRLAENTLGSEHANPLPPAVILFGSPGSGKGTQAKLLRKCLRGPHISTGDMLRMHIQHCDEIGRQTETLLRSGKLVADDLVNELVEERIGQEDARAGIILDGYPRTLNQAGVLLGLLRTFGFQPGVVHLMVDYEKIVARLSGRRQCPVCGTLYNLTTNPPKVAGVCDLDGATLVTRPDDREEVIRQRLTEYESQTRPILEYFREAGVPMFEIDGADRPPDVIAQEICNELQIAGAARETAAGLGVKAADESVVS